VARNLHAVISNINQAQHFRSADVCALPNDKARREYCSRKDTERLWYRQCNMNTLST